MERVSRIKDSKQTHIVLGSDSVPTLSEKVSESSTHNVQYYDSAFYVCIHVFRWLSLA